MTVEFSVAAGATVGVGVSSALARSRVVVAWFAASRVSPGLKRVFSVAAGDDAEEPAKPV